MKKGFVSLLFLLVLAQVLVTLQTVDPPHVPYSGIPLHTLALKRAEIEYGIDSIIRIELYNGIVGQLPDTGIQTNINGRIVEYLNDLSYDSSPFTYEMGIGKLDQVSYLSLLQSPLLPLTTSALNQRSHVLVLPINQTQSYGEYSYTGGLFGTEITLVKIRTPLQQTLFALPSGYHVCTTTLRQDLPCITP